MPANIGAVSVKVDDLDGMREEFRAIWDGLESKALPRMVLCHPQTYYDQELTVAWEGAPSKSAFNRLIDSPARREIVRSMAAGQAGVFVLLESGNNEKDKAAAAVVQKALNEFSEEFELPLYAKQAMGLPLDEEVEVTFSLLRIAREDPDEEALMDIVQIGFPESEIGGREPLLSTVFGRGRILPFLVGDDISEDNLFYYLGYLSGNCSCEIKWQNPGFDLLIRSNWYKVLAGEVPPPLPHTSRKVAVTKVTPQRADANAASAASTETSSPLLRNLLIAAGAVLILVAALTAILMRRAGKETV
jgi:hypothetical protein